MDQINFNYLFIGTLLIAGTLSVVSGLVALVSGLRSRRWPCITGVVTISKAVSVRTKQNREPKWAPQIRYQYTVNKTKLTGTSIRFGMEGLSAGRKFAATYIDRYPVGKVVQVFYEPDRPENAVLEPGISVEHLWPMGIGVALLVLGFAFVLHELSRVAS